MFQTPLKSKGFHASDSALDNAQHRDDETRVNRAPSSGLPVRRPDSSPRYQQAKSHLSHSKSSDKSGSGSSGTGRYVISLDQNGIPKFHDKNNQKISFGAAEIELWIRRLRILYQIDRGRQYGDAIDRITSILQYIPGAMLATLTRIRRETFSIDEMFLNDVARARMFMLEEWSSDGLSVRNICLAHAYYAMSPINLASEAENLQIAESSKHNSEIPTLMVTQDPDLQTQFDGLSQDNENS